jgi:hypothetical protein
MSPEGRIYILWGVKKTLLKMQFDREQKLQIAGESQYVMSSVSISSLRHIIRIVK